MPTEINREQELRWVPSLSPPAPAPWLGAGNAPGHVSEFTQHLPFEMVDEALAATKTPQSRLRALPSPVEVYLLLAACLFPEVEYCGAWCMLTAALEGLPIATPTAGGLSQARRALR